MASKQSVTSSNRRMEREFRQLGKRLDGLIEKTRNAEATARVKYAGQIRALKKKQVAAKKVLARLQRQTAAASNPLKVGLRKAWRDLDSAVKQATKRFRETS